MLRYTTSMQAITTWHQDITTTTWVTSDTSYSGETEKFSYSEVDVYDVRRQGTCTEFTELFSGAASKSILYQPSAIVLTAINTLPEVFVTSELLEIDVSKYSVVCKDSAVLETILERINTDDDASLLEVACGGRTWKVNTCAGHADDAGDGIAMCVDCADPCGDVDRCTAYNASSFAVAPCNRGGCSNYLNDNSLADNDKSVMMSVYFQDRYPPPGIVEIQAEAAGTTRTSLNISLELNSPGTVYCGVFEDGVVPSSAEEIVLQNYLGFVESDFDGDGNFDSFVVIDQLSPATSYDVYCMPYSLYGTKSELHAVLRKNTTASTACCRMVEVSFPTSIYEGSDYYSFLRVSLLSKPSGSDFGVHVNISSYANGTAQNQMAVPGSFNLDASFSTDTVLYSSLRAGVMGSYFVNVTFSGAEAANWDVTYNTGTMLTMLSTNFAQPAPRILSAIFADDGASITVTFSGSTNYGGLRRSFDCSDLFVFKEVSSGSEVTVPVERCTWEDAASVKLWTGSDDTLWPDDHEVHIVSDNDLISACTPPGCDVWPRVNTSSGVGGDYSAAISTASAPVTPVVAISAPVTIGSCDDVKLDISSSSGSGGRQWTSVSVSVTSTGSAANTSHVQDYLDASYKGRGTALVPFDYLLSGLSYGFSVTLCNFFGKCAVVTHQVSKLDTVMPAVKIFGSTLRSGPFRPIRLQLKGSAGVASCGGGTTAVSSNNTRVTTEWRVLQNNVQQGDLVSMSSDPSKFVLAPFTLTPGLVYEVQFLGMITSDTSAPRISTSSVNVYVERSDLVPVVLGGLDRNLPFNGTLDVDASGSYDLDQDGLTGVTAGLVYSWSCMQLQPISDRCSVSLIGGTDGVLTVYAGEGSSETVSRITMTMRDSAGVRSSTRDIQITVLDPLQPVVELDSTTVRAASSGKVSPSSSLYVQGDVTLLGTGTCAWTVDDSAFNLDEASLVPTTRAISRSGTTALNFVIAPFTLPQGATLVFTLTCTQYASAAVYGSSGADEGVDYSQMADQVGISSIAVEINSPPSPGIFAVSPTYGTELQDIFDFESSLWNDDDLPITYQYGFVSPGGRLMPVQTRSESAAASVILPAGDALLDYELRCVATIFDSLDANTTVSQSTYVNETLDAASEGVNLLSSVAGSQDLDTVFAAVSVTMSVVNTVNCTLAPNCTTLHRSKCAQVAATCGACLEGYDGVLGDSNAPCYNSSWSTGAAASRRRLSPFGRALPSLLSSGGCYSDDDCSGFEACTSGGICEMRSKTCPGGDVPCMGYGECVFFEYSTRAAGPSVEVSTCLDDDFSCQAKCRCDDGYTGTSCELTAVQAAKREEARALAVDGLTQVFNSSGVGESIDSVTSALLALTEASQDYTELSYNSTLQLMTLLDTLATDVLLNGYQLPYDKIGLFMDIVEKVAAQQEAKKNVYLQALNNTPSTHNTQMISTVSTALFDGPDHYSGEEVDGTFTLVYNATMETGSIPARATGDDVVAALSALPAFDSLVADGSLTIDITRRKSASLVEEDGSLYEATHAVPGAYSLSCNSKYSTCGFELLPVGELIMIRGEVTGGHGDFAGRWYRVHDSFRPGLHSNLPLAEEDDSSVPTTYKGSSPINGTLLRWGHGYSYLVTFSGPAIYSNPWMVAPLETGVMTAPHYGLQYAAVVTTASLDQPYYAKPNNTGIVESERLQALMAACGEMVSSSMVSGQASYDVVKSGFRMTVTMLNSVEDASDSSSSTRGLQVPLSDTEQVLSSSTSSMAIPMKVLEDGETAESVAVSFMSVDSSLYELDSEVESDVVVIELSAVPRYFDKSTDGRFNVTIPTAHSQSYAYPVMPVIETRCGDDEWSTYSYHCEQVVMADPVASAFPGIETFYNPAQWISVTCNGTYSILESRCDLIYTQPTCDTVTGAGTGDAAVTDAGCVLVDYDDTTTTCSCPMSAATTTRRRTRRRLADANATDSGAVQLNYVALADSAVSTFTSTWSSAGDLDAESVEDGMQVLVVMSTLIFLVVASLVTVHRWDRVERIQNAQDGKRKLMIKDGAVAPDAGALVPAGATVLIKRMEEKKKSKKQRAQEAVEAAEKEEEDQEKRLMFRKRQFQAEHWRKVRSHVRDNATIIGEEEEELAFVEQTLPSVFHSKPFFVRLLQELKNFHRWACIVYTYSETFPRSMRVVSMASNIIVTLFIQALTYNFTNPDDGTCPTYEAVDACLEDSSTFDESVPKCYWVPRRVGGKCHFREPENTLSIVVFVAVFSAIVAIPILVSMEWVLKNVLSAKTRHTAASNQGSLYKRHLKAQIAEKEAEAKAAKQLENLKGGAAETTMMPLTPGGVALKTEDGEMAELHPALLRYTQSSAFANRSSQIDEAGGKGTGKKKRRGSKNDELRGAISTANAAGGSSAAVSPSPRPRQRQRRRSSLLNILTFSQATDSVLTTSLQEDLGNLIEGIRKYRLTLPVEERDEFDFAWGIDPDAGRFRDRRLSSVANIMGAIRRNSLMAPRANDTNGTNGSIDNRSQGNRAWLQSNSNNGGNDGDVQQRITQDLEDVRNTVDEDYSELSTQPALAEDINKGKHLLNLFQRDLLPGINGEILASKNARDAKRVVVVSPWAKMLGWTAIVLVNLGMLFYVYLFALSQTQTRQGAWLQSFMLWFIMEVFIVSTVICYVTHFLIPSVVSTDLQKVKRKLLDTVRDYNERLKKQLEKRKKARRDSIAQRLAGVNTPMPPLQPDGEVEDSVLDVDTPPQHALFNAAQYFFVSYRLAAKFPTLKESKIIRAFHTQWPRVSYYQNKKDVSQSYNALATSIGRSVAMVVFYLLGNLMQLPASFQDIFVGMFCTAAVGYTALLHISLYEWLPVLVVLPAIVLLLLAHFFIRWNEQVRRMQASKTTPIRTDEADDGKDGKDGKADDEKDGEAGLLTEEALRKMEKARKDAFSVPVDALTKGAQAYTEDKKSNSSSSSSDGDAGAEGTGLPVRTSVKRGSVGSLASIDTADQFSDLSFDAGTPGVSPTIGGAHLANHDVSSSVPADSRVSVFRRASISRGLEAMQALIGAQEEQLDDAEAAANPQSGSGKVSRTMKQRLSFKKESSLDSVKYANVTIAEGDDEAGSSIISSSSSDSNRGDANRGPPVISPALLAAAAGAGEGDDSDSGSSVKDMYQLSSDEDSQSPLHLAKGQTKPAAAAAATAAGSGPAATSNSGGQRPSKFAQLMKSGKKKPSAKRLLLSTDSSSSGSGNHNVSIRIRDKAGEAGKQELSDDNPEMTHPPPKPSFSAPLRVAEHKSTVQVPTRNQEPLSPTKQDTATKLEALQSRMASLEQRHAALQDRKAAGGTPPENTSRRGTPGNKGPHKPPKPMKSVTRGLIASGRLTGGLKKGLTGPVSGLKATPKNLEKRKVDAAAILKPTEFHGHDDIDIDF